MERKNNVKIFCKMSVTEEWTEIYVKEKETPCTELKIGLQRLTDLCHGSCDLWVWWGFDFSVGSSCQSVLTCTEMEYLNQPPPENTPWPSEALSTAGNIHPRWADRTGDWSILSNIGWQDLRWVCVPLRLGRFVWRGRIKQSKQDRGAHGAQRRRENIWGKERRASNRDIDLSAHGPHVWQLNRQHDWLHEGGFSASPWRIVLVKREWQRDGIKSLAHITIESKDARQLTYVKKKRAVTPIPLKTLWNYLMTRVFFFFWCFSYRDEFAVYD